MIAKLMASIAASETLIAAALVGIGVGVATEPGVGLAAFGTLWYLPNLIERSRRRG